jgi:hypothetical protein
MNLLKRFRNRKLALMALLSHTRSAPMPTDSLISATGANRIPDEALEPDGGAWEALDHHMAKRRAVPAARRCSAVDRLSMEFDITPTMLQTNRAASGVGPST